jgi:histidinol phosphatase-like enzyme
MHRSRPAPTTPIPGTGAPARGLFVARSGVLFQPSSRDNAHFDPERFSEQVLPLLFRATQNGWTLYLVGNEEAVARGKISDTQWESFEIELSAHLKAQCIVVKKCYAALESPEGKGKHRRDSVFRFPNTGVLYHAAQEDGIELGESWMISSDLYELAAGWRAGLRLAAVAFERPSADSELRVEPGLCAATARAALSEILARDPLLVR